MKEKCEKKKQQQQQHKDREKQGGRSYSERVRAKRFCCVFKLGFLQLLFKASLIFKSNLELALSVILKERELYESEHVVVFKNMRLVFLFYMFLNLSFRMTTRLANIARTTDSTNKFIYYERFQITRNWIFI